MDVGGVMKRETTSIHALHLVDFVEEVEGCGIAALNREDESQSHHGLLAS